ncbi:unnamed protein product [Choristocarpus tenellus]
MKTAWQGGHSLKTTHNTHPSKMDATVNAGVVGATALTLAAGGLLFLWGRGGSSLEEVSGDDEGALPTVSKAQVVAFFDAINFQQQAMMLNFNQQVEQFRGKVPEEQLLQLGGSQFEENLAKVQGMELERVGVDEEDMEEASNHFIGMGDQQVKAGADKLLSLYLSMSRGIESTAELPDNLTVEKVLKVLDIFHSVNDRLLVEVIEGLQAQGKSLSNQETMQELHMIFTRRSESDLNKALKPLGLNHEMIQPALVKFQNNKTVQQKLKEGTEQQQARLMTYGLM